MKHRVTMAAIGLFAIGTLAATSCSKDAASTTAGPNASTTAVSSGAGASPTTGASGAANGGGSGEACKLLTTTEAVTLVPGVGDGKPGVAGGGGSMCKFEAPDKSLITIQLENGKAYYIGDSMKAPDNETVPGVGDKNAVHKSGSTFAILKGDKSLFVTTGTVGTTVKALTDAQRLAAAKSLMATISGRM